MKKTAAIIFLTIYIFSTTEISQLLKLPNVFQHFAEHSIEDKTISFLQFLAIHYLHGSPKDNDYDRDMQLPFKTSNTCISTISPAFIPLMPEFSIAKPLVLPEKKKNFPIDQLAISPYLSSIWQPPKSC